MAGNELERAVITAARRLVGAIPGFTAEVKARAELEAAVMKLDDWLAAQEPGISEVGWHEVAEGDEVQSVRNRKFYVVKKTLKIKGGKYQITLDKVPNPITRPTADEPTATVRRGPVGAAVDTLIHVFSSGGPS